MRMSRRSSLSFGNKSFSTAPVSFVVVGFVLLVFYSASALHGSGSISSSALMDFKAAERMNNYSAMVENFDFSRADSCSPEKARTLATYVNNRVRKNRSWSACPHTTWMKEFIRIDKDRILSSSNPEKPLTFLNIGANKGYALAEWIAEAVPSAEINPKSLRELYREKVPHLKNLCGICMDCKYSAEPSSDFELDQKLRMETWIAEPALANLELLSHMKDWVVNKCSDYHLKLEVLENAFSDAEGTVSFPRISAGAEDAYIDQDNVGQSVQVDVMTIDNFFNRRGIKFLDYVKIDTEGFDPMVLKGASKVLSEHRIRVLVFEYHKLNHWKTTSLENVVSQLDTYGYDCYFDGNAEVVRLTRCWHRNFEFRWWSNVVCISRIEEEFTRVLYRMKYDYSLQ